MRIAYQPVPHPLGKVVTRPCCDVVFLDDSDRIRYMALIDSGSLHTIVPESALEGVDIGEQVSKLDILRFCGYYHEDVPIHRLDMEILPPLDGHRSWDSIELPDVSVCVIPGELPFVVLGSTALSHVAVVLREHDGIVHLKPIGQFHGARHHEDPTF